VLFSCTKIGKNLTVKRKVVNPLTGEPFPGVKAELLVSGTLQLPGGGKEIKSTVTDENGNFELNKFSFKADKVRLGDAHGDYFTIGWYKDGEYISDGNTLPIKKGKKLNVDLHLVPYGEIKTSLHNVNCGGPEDTLIFKRSYMVSPTDNVFLPFTFTGCFNNDGAFAKVPNGNYKLEWIVIRSGISNTFSHMLFVPENGQAFYNIDY
jgi:hypothetical protein